MKQFIAALEARRIREGMTIREFGFMLGVSEGAWSRVRSGSRGPGRRVILGGLRLYPELASVLADDVRNGASTSATRRRKAS